MHLFSSAYQLYFFFDLLLFKIIFFWVVYTRSLCISMLIFCLVNVCQFDFTDTLFVFQFYHIQFYPNLCKKTFFFAFEVVSIMLFSPFCRNGYRCIFHTFIIISCCQRYLDSKNEIETYPTNRLMGWKLWFSVINFGLVWKGREFTGSWELYEKLINSMVSFSYF